ncbi:MAG TPA: FG-GAP-like repeat-containing protein [Chryseolinea sp.]|nr:FG-GAP-like repeat-containing protein [Chryseolinea sp.]
MKKVTSHVKRSNTMAIAKFKIAIALLFSLTEFSNAQITSTFNSNADGWTFSDQNLSSSQTINFSSTGGNPGGSISSTVATSNYFHFTSPSKFAGNISYFSYGQSLSFDLQMPVTPTQHGGNGDVSIRLSTSQEYVYTLPTLPAVAPAWSSYTIKLDETAGWRIGSPGGPLATKAQMLALLSNVGSIRINGKFIATVPAASASLDNVILEQRAIQPAPTITSTSPMSGKAGTSITINGSGFGTTVANNTVFFGGMAATINSASSIQLTVTVPIGASLDKIFVTNKTTGLTTSTSQLFIPTFENGGRIIPASFGIRQDIFLGSGTRVAGVAIADLDSDGWNELIAGEHASNSVAIFPNLGNGGDLSASSFGSKISLSGGGNGIGLIVKDLDGDGKLDILCGSNSAFNYFATFRNISTPGNIAFEAVELWAGLVYSGFITASEDVDGDGLIDLIGQHGNGSASPDFWIAQNLSNPGNIEFNTSISFFGSSMLDAGAGVSTGDLNNDGKIDFVVKHGFGGAFSIIENTSTPGIISLANPILFSETAQGDIRIADLNQDGKNEIIFAELYNGDDVQIKINTHTTGPITASDFQTEIALKSEMFYSSGGVSLSDLNGDGKLDIILTDPTNLGYFENVYDGGTFTAKSFVEAYISDGGGSSTYPQAPISGDLNGDGRPDVVFGITNAAARISLFQNKNVHTPIISLNTVSPLKGEAGSTVTITGDYFSTTLSENKVMFGDVQAAVTSATKTKLTVTVPLGASIAAVSVTRDKLTSTYHLPFVPTFSPDVMFDNTHFAPPVNFLLTSALYDIDAGDLNNDGKVDIVADVGSTKIITFRNTHGTGSIASSSLMADDTLNGTYYPHIFDLDGDGRGDVVGVTGPLQNLSQGSEINFGAYSYVNPGGHYFNDFADFNKDGKVEFIGVNASNVLIVENRTSQIAFSTNTVTSTFGPPVSLPKPSNFGSVVAVDFDKDGLIDIAATNPSTNNISLWKNTGSYRVSSSQFTVLPEISIGVNPSRIYASDIDNDGKMDLLIQYNSGASSLSMTILHNQSTAGTISFTQFDLTIPVIATVVNISDLDGDGKPDIIATSETGNQFFILKNIFTSGVMSASSFAAPFSAPVTSPRGLATADLNLDGKPEIIITAAPNSLLVYENLIPVGPSITINTQPSTIAVCSGAIVSLSTSGSGTTNLAYQWQKFDGSVFTNLTNGNGFSGANTSTLTITTTTSFGDGDYRCMISGDAASSVFTTTASVTFTTSTTVAEITNNGTTLMASPGYSYQWYQNGVAISGATNQSFEFNFLEYGLYTVDVTKNGCTSTSAPFEYLITGNENFADKIKMYPNPIDVKLSIEFIPPYDLSIVDVTGKVIHQMKIETEIISINLSDLSKGIYVLHIKNIQQHYNLRISKR